MRTFSIAVALASAATGCWTHDAPARRTPIVNVAPAAPKRVVSSLAGEYRRSHMISVICDGGVDGWCDAGAEDVLTIQDTRRGAIAVQVELMQTNAHSCTFEGELAPVRSPPPGVQQWVFDHEDEVGPCTLTLEKRGSEIAISSESCRYYCGARASLDATFALTDRVR